PRAGRSRCRERGAAQFPDISYSDITRIRTGRGRKASWKGISLKLKRAERRFKLATRDYAQLAAFRHTLRKFLRFSELAASRVGLTTQHYQAMLVVRGWPEDRR